MKLGAHVKLSFKFRSFPINISLIDFWQNNRPVGTLKRSLNCTIPLSFESIDFLKLEHPLTFSKSLARLNPAHSVKYSALPRLLVASDKSCSECLLHFATSAVGLSMLVFLTCQHNLKGMLVINQQNKFLAIAERVVCFKKTSESWLKYCSTAYR